MWEGEIGEVRLRPARLGFPIIEKVLTPNGWQIDGFVSITGDQDIRGGAQLEHSDV